MEPEPEVVSTFFSSNIKLDPTISSNSKCITGSGVAEDFLHIIDELNISLEQYNLPVTVHAVYNPTIYARHTFEMYVRKYCDTKKPIMYFGMNPGPWGMSQTGVPFGEIDSVKNWLGIEGPVGKPDNEIASRQVMGFKCTRTEISGKRFWGLFKDICGTPDKFFQTSFVYNYLPQQWMKSSGCNQTPGDFPASKMDELYRICDPAFIKVLELYDVQIIVAIGKFCESRAQKAIQRYLSGNNIKVLYLPHPSPRTVNNQNWDKKAVECLKELNLLKYYE